jgi:hypothetical protein
MDSRLRVNDGCGSAADAAPVKRHRALRTEVHNEKASGDGEHRLPPFKGIPFAAAQAFISEL